MMSPAPNEEEVILMTANDEEEINTGDDNDYDYDQNNKSSLQNVSAISNDDNNGNRNHNNISTASSSAARNNNNNISTSYIDAEDDNLPQEVQTFADQLLNDLDAASVALRTYISVLGGSKSSSSSASSTEGKQCVGVVKRSGLLMDTVLPKKVVKYFHWTADELNVAPNAPEDTSIVDSIQNGDLSGVSSLGATMRQRLLKQIHRLNDAKTCLRYITSLAEAGPSQEQLLKVFIRRVGKTIQ